MSDGPDSPQPPPPVDPGAVATDAPTATPGFRPGVVATGVGPQEARTGPPKGVLRRSTINRLGPQTRSVVVPSVLLLVLSVAAVGLVMAGVILAGLALTESEPSPAECRQRTAELTRAIQSYSAEEGQAPRSMTDLVPDYVDQAYTTHGIDFDQRPPKVVVFQDGPCDVDGARAGAQVSDDVGQQGLTLGVMAFVAGGLALIVAGGLALPILALQGYWMSVAYRGVLPSRRRYPVKAAYTPLITYVGGGLFVYTVLALVNSHLRDDPEIGQAIFSIVYLIWWIALIVVVVRWLNMLAQVNHSFGRMSFAARLVKGSLIWMVAQNVLTPLMVVVALVIADSVPLASLIILILVGANLIITPVVGIVSYIVALVLATVQIDRSLDAAAEELTRLESAGWLEIEPSRS